MTKAKQNWEIGQTVKVGFVSDLSVVKKVHTYGDMLPDLYVLVHNTTGRVYSFVPHNGLSRHASISEAEMAW